MHVVIVPSERYLTEDEPEGGIFQRDQADALRRKGLRVGVLAPAPRSMRQLGKLERPAAGAITVEDDGGIPVYRYEGWGWTTGRLPWVTEWSWRRNLRRLYARYCQEHGRPDVIHAHNAILAGAIVARLCRRGGPPYVLTEHSTSYALGGVRGWRTPLARRAFRAAAARVFVSPHLAEVVQARFHEAVEPWEWIPNVLDSRFEEAALPDRLPVPSDGSIRILNVAALIEVKNQALLIEAFAEGFCGSPRVELRIGGVGPLRPQLEGLAGRLGVGDRVLFLGRLTREQVLREMLSCDVFVLPSKYETFGVVLIEALACGKPVVAMKGSGPDCIVDSGNGVLVPRQDRAMLASALNSVVERRHSFQPSRLRSECLARFGSEAVATRLVSLYEGVIERCGR